jgi:hypothetical protein
MRRLAMRLALRTLSGKLKEVKNCNELCYELNLLLNIAGIGLHNYTREHIYFAPYPPSKV